MLLTGLTPRTNRLTANFYRFFLLFQNLFYRFLVDNFFSSSSCSIGGRASVFFEAPLAVMKLLDTYNSGFLQPGGAGSLVRIPRIGVAKTSFCVFGIRTVEITALVYFLTVAQHADFRLTSLQSPFFASLFYKHNIGVVNKILLPSVHFNDWPSFRLLSKVEYLSNSLQFPSRVASVVILQLVLVLQITAIMCAFSLSFRSGGNH